MDSQIVTENRHETSQSSGYLSEFETARLRLLALARRAIPGIRLGEDISWPDLKGAIHAKRPGWDADGVDQIDDLEQLLKSHIKLSRQYRASIGIGERLRARDLLCIPNGESYQYARRAISGVQSFRATDESAYPTAIFEGRDSITKIQLKPESARMLPQEQEQAAIQQMWDQAKRLSDLDADVLDALMAIWVQAAKGPNDDVMASVDDLLRLRGLQEKKNGDGRRGGFEEKQRAEMLSRIHGLENFWVEFHEGAKRPGQDAIRSRAVSVNDEYGQYRTDGTLDVRAVLFRPGRVFGQYLLQEGRQTALLSKIALEYDPYRQGPEKRLIRYLAWQWRIRARSGNYSQGFTVRNLLDEAGIEVNERHPSRTLERLEKALDQITEDRAANSWDYDRARWDAETDGAARGWLRKWLTAVICIEPPDAVRDHYLKHGLEAEPQPIRVKIPATATLGARVAAERKARGWSQAIVSESLGITQAYLSQIERGKAGKLSATVSEKLTLWLSELPEI